jgi:DEAD/DEAH box helicase domain-containing protein
MTDPTDVLDLLARTSDGEGGGLVHHTRLPTRRADSVALPDDLPDALVTRLRALGIDTLWRHQLHTLTHARAGQHTVVATATASGKSLAMHLPVLEALLTDEGASALYLAPTKALAHDQLRSLRSLHLPQLRAAVIDGDTPHAEREAIRRTANLILTNPDLLHHRLLGDHARWADLLHRLRFVLVDEAHASRGVFGGHVALVLRRLARLAERYGATPTWLFATATIGNPAEHASRLAGIEVAEVVDDGAPSGALTVGLWEPPSDDGRRRSTLREAGGLLASLVAAGVQTLVFTRSRKAAEVVALIAKERLGDASEDGIPLADRVAAYRAGYLAEDRRALEADLRSGALRGVAATQALELGIDVSGLDAVVLAGWPGTTASFWQRVGRAGRRGGPAIAVLVAEEDPLDQYLLRHPDALLDRPPEDAAIDPGNPYLLGPHLRCACQEAPLTVDEARDRFGDGAPALLAADVEAGTLRLRAGRHHYAARGRAAAEVSLRTTGRQVRIVDTTTGAVIGDVDEARAHRQVHTGALYLHQGELHKIEELDLDRGVALASRSTETDLTTRVRVDTDVSIVSVGRQRTLGDASACLGPVTVTTQVTGFDLVRVGADEVVEHVALDLPAITLDTMATWLMIPDQLLERAGVSRVRAPGSLHAAEHAAIGMLPLIALCDRWDLGGLSTLSHPDAGTPTIFVYDAYPGGAGLAERSWSRIEEHLGLTRDTIGGCPCEDGCLGCVHSPKCGNGNDPLDKRGALALLRVLLTTAPAQRPLGR